jgi:hypothetical protein
VSNDDFRAEQAERRQHGLKARHEQRLENATYTAAEVKVLTADACKFAYALGRKEAGEEIATKFETQARLPSMRGTPTGEMLLVCAAVARDLAWHPSQDATSGRTDLEVK